MALNSFQLFFFKTRKELLISSPSEIWI